MHYINGRAGGKPACSTSRRLVPSPTGLHFNLECLDYTTRSKIQNLDFWPHQRPPLKCRKCTADRTIAITHPGDTVAYRSRLAHLDTVSLLTYMYTVLSCATPIFSQHSKTRNSSLDEIANVNFLYDDIVHPLKIQ